MLTARAHAKVNLFLHITGKRQDGYHLLESLIAFAEVHDTLHISTANTITLEITGRFAANLNGDPQLNIILKAAHLLAEKAGITQGASITLDKQLPIASGIGGGSSDAAAALHLLSEYWKTALPHETMLDIALSLGADVPCCYHKKPGFMSGIGEKITLFPSMPSLPALLVNPLQSVSTPEVFKVGVKQFSPSHPISTLPTTMEEFIALLQGSHNDLEAPAITVLPAIADLLVLIGTQRSCKLSRMSGSGATCFGLFSTYEAAEDAARAIQNNHPEWWVEPTILGQDL